MKIKIAKTIEFEGLTDLQENCKIYCRGYAIYNAKLYREREFAELILEHYIQGKVQSTLKDYSGCWQFTLIDIKADIVFVANDRWGSYPLFYYEDRDQFLISNDRHEFIALPQMKLAKTSALELGTLGYVLGDKTLLKGVKDFSAHTYTQFSLKQGFLEKQESSYWQFSYHHEPANEKEKEIEFSQLWEKRMAIYSDFLNKSNSGVYLPFSGGLDCRLLANELDKQGVRTTALTYGLSREYKEIDCALRAFSLLDNKAGHYLEYLTESTVAELKTSPYYPDPLTCAHYGQMMMDYHSKVEAEFPYIMTGFTGDLVGGSLIKNKMLKWKFPQQIMEHVINLRSAPLYKHIVAHPDYHEELTASLRASIPDDSGDIVSTYVRWFVENDARRYLIRSIIPHDNYHDRVLLPFFDYEIFDFFLCLPVKLLINKRLYVNSQIKYLYRNNPQLLKVERAKPFRKVKSVRNQLWEEYYPKLILKSGLPSQLKRDKKTVAYDDMDWLTIYNDLELPDFLPSDLLDHPVLNKKPSYIKFLHPVSRVYKELKQK